MRLGLATLVVLFAAVAHGADGADGASQATGTVDGRPVQFPGDRVAEGVPAVVGLLESCHDESLFRPDELQKARRGDHVRLLLPEPVAARVMGEKVEFTELVFRLPLNTGVFWVRSGDRWRRFSKYEYQKEKPFVAWLREARPAE